MNDIDEQMEQVFGIAEKVIPKTAELIKKMYDELKKQGLPEEVIIGVLSNYKVG